MKNSGENTNIEKERTESWGLICERCEIRCVVLWSKNVQWRQGERRGLQSVFDARDKGNIDNWKLDLA